MNDSEVNQQINQVRPAAEPPAAPRSQTVQRTPNGYVKGAICIEPPKRQRTQSVAVQRAPGASPSAATETGTS